MLVAYGTLTHTLHGPFYSMPVLSWCKTTDWGVTQLELARLTLLSLISMLWHWPGQVQLTPDIYIPGCLEP